MTQNRSIPQLEQLREAVKQKFPIWQGFASAVIDRACCFSYTIPRDVDDYDQDNSIVILHEEFAPKLVSSESLSEHTATSTKQTQPKEANYVFMEPKNGDIQKAAWKSPGAASSTSTVTTATSRSRSQGSWASLQTVKTCTTIAWDDFDAMEDIDDREQRSPRASSRREIPVPSVSSKTFIPSRHVRRWSGVDKDVSEECVSSIHLYQDPMAIRKVQSECKSELPFLSASGGYEI